MVSVKLCPCGQPGIPAQTGYSVSTLATSGFPGGSDGKEFPCDTGDPGSVFGLGRSLEKEMATHSSILAWRIPWREEPGGLPSMGLQRVGHDLVT